MAGGSAPSDPPVHSSLRVAGTAAPKPSSEGPMLVDVFMVVLATVSWLFLVAVALGHGLLSPIARTRDKLGYV